MEHPVRPDPTSLFRPPNQVLPPPPIAAGPCLLKLSWAAPVHAFPASGYVSKLLREAGATVIAGPFEVSVVAMLVVARLAAPVLAGDLFDRIHAPLKVAGYPLTRLDWQPVSERDALGYSVAEAGYAVVEALAPLVQNWLASRQGRL